MKPRITVLTLGVDDLDVALRFYRDGLGFPTDGIVGTEFVHGAVVFIELQPGLRLALWPRNSIAHDTGLASGPASATELTLGHNVGSRKEVDAVMAKAELAGARVVKPGHDTFWGGYSGYFQDPDGHLWEVVWNPQWQDEAAPALVAEPDDTAVRTALWRALHVLADPPPHVLRDEIGLHLVAPPADWAERPDMSEFTRPFRASILARARFVEDLVLEQLAHGVNQYVILGAGLDTFAQRHSQLGTRLRVFEIDQSGPQAWKRKRLLELGFGIAPALHLVPVDFEAGTDWWKQLTAAGFDAAGLTVVASLGVSMYLTKEAIVATLRQVATLPPGSTFVMSFMLPIDQQDPAIRSAVERAAAGAHANGTPFISFFTPDEMLALARTAGFREFRHVSSGMLAQRYFADRSDGLCPPGKAEELLVALT